MAMSLGVFLFARLFRMPQPCLVALAFPAGALLGGAASVLLAVAVIGVDPKLTSTSQILGYLAFLGVGSLSSGVLAAWFCKRVLSY